MKSATTSKGGRPRKYPEPSRPVTVTLPLSTLDSLERIDPDRGKAIVKAVKHAAPDQHTHQRQPVEIVKVTANAGLIVVGPSKALRRISWLSLVEITPTRYLLSVPTGTSVDSLEIAVMDQLEDVGASDMNEKRLLESLLDKIRTLRRSRRVSKGELLFVEAE
jgi:hypothetical protein